MLYEVITHAEGDATGKVVTRFMLQRVSAKKNIQAFENTTVVDLLVKNNKCYGARITSYNVCYTKLLR